MSIVKCRECGGEVSDNAKTCPKCGASVTDKRKLLAVIVAVVGVSYFVNTLLPSHKTTSNSVSEVAATTHLQPTTPVEPASAPEETKPPEATPLQKLTQSKKPEDFKYFLMLNGKVNNDWWNLCVLLGKEIRNPKSRRVDVLTEFLIQERMINEDDPSHVAKKRVAVGMTICGMFASWGLPKDTTVTEGRNYRHEQHVYSNARYVLHA